MIAMMLDLYIRRASHQKNSLDTLFKRLYNDFAPHKRGYREQDVKSIASELSNDGVNAIFEKHIDGLDSYEPLLNELLSFVGCYVSRVSAKNTHERCFGFKTIQEGGNTKVVSVYPASLAELLYMVL